jgi:hypothetical protein
VAAFALSFVTYRQLNQTPDVATIMPNKVRVIFANKNNYASVYLQPTFTASRKTERPAVLSNVRLLVQPQAPSKIMPPFFWVENVRMEQRDDGTYIRRFESDPAPVVIYGDQPVSPMLAFSSETPTPPFEVGKVRMTLLLDWHDSPSETNDFCIELTQLAMNEINKPDETGKMQTFMKHAPSECLMINL